MEGRLHRARTIILTSNVKTRDAGKVVHELVVSGITPMTSSLQQGRSSNGGCLELTRVPLVTESGHHRPPHRTQCQEPSGSSVVPVLSNAHPGFLRTRHNLESNFPRV